MPRIGEIRKAKEVGYQGYARFIWHACEHCKKERWVQYNQLKAGRHKLCQVCGCKKRGLNCRMDKAYNWKGGKYKNVHGYRMIYIPIGSPFREMAGPNGNGYVAEHRLVMAKHLGRMLKSSEQVHHKDGIKLNNKVNNLELLTKSEHTMSHCAGYRDGYSKGLKDGRLKQIALLRLKIKELEKKIEND